VRRDRRLRLGGAGTLIVPQFVGANEGQRWLRQLRTSPNARVVSASGELQGVV
jgi:hypothetical protein